jgi:hypothetical protein
MFPPEMACFASAKSDSASERWRAEVLAFGTAGDWGHVMGDSDFNLAYRSKKRARIELFGCRFKETPFGIFFKFFLRPQCGCRIGIVVGNVS